MRPRTGLCTGPPGGWASFTWPRCDAFCRLCLQIPPGLICVVGEEVEDLLCVPDWVTMSAAPGDTLRAATLGKVPKLLGWGGREPCGAARFSRPCCPRAGLGRAASAGQDAAGLAAAQNSFALVTDNFDVLMEAPSGCLRPQVAFPTFPGLGHVFRHGDCGTTGS